jgi:hypothetical protein
VRTPGTKTACEAETQAALQCYKANSRSLLLAPNPHTPTHKPHTQTRTQRQVLGVQGHLSNSMEEDSKP